MSSLCFATPSEAAATLPGDHVIDTPQIVSTHAITIAAAPHVVWSWLVQIGQDRGGFYSYTLLENLLGCRMKNADAIHPEWQQLSAGDPVALHPRAAPLIVHQLEPASHLVLWQQRPLLWTWAFQLQTSSDESCRLLARTRIARGGCLSRVASVTVYPVMTLGHYVMERRMLLGIRQRAERSS